MVKKTFGINLKLLRTSAGITQKELALASGSSQVAIANYENGSRFPAEEMILKLADILGVTPGALFFEIEKSEEKYSPEIFYTDIREGNTKQASDLLYREFLRSGKNMKKILSDYFIDALKKTGICWQQGVCSVFEEHLYSHRIRSVICSFFSKMEQKDKKKGVFMGICVPGEEHDLVLLMISEYLRVMGFHVYFAGINVPFDDLKKAVKSFKPDIILFSQTRAELVNTLQLYIDNLQQLKKETGFLLAAGGFGVSHLEKIEGADQIFPQMNEALEYLENEMFKEDQE